MSCLIQERTDGVLNRNTVATLAFNKVNDGKQMQDETMIEQLYQFQQYHDGRPIISTVNSS